MTVTSSLEPWSLRSSSRVQVCAVVHPTVLTFTFMRLWPGSSGCGWPGSRLICAHDNK